jgi:hypothetical protein
MAQINACDKKLALIKKIVDSMPEYYYLSPYHKSDYVNIAFDDFIKSKGRTLPLLNKYAAKGDFLGASDGLLVVHPDPGIGERLERQAAPED